MQLVDDIVCSACVYLQTTSGQVRAGYVCVCVASMTPTYTATVGVFTTAVAILGVYCIVV